MLGKQKRLGRIPSLKIVIVSDEKSEYLFLRRVFNNSGLAVLGLETNRDIFFDGWFVAAISCHGVRTWPIASRSAELVNADRIVLVDVGVVDHLNRKGSDAFPWNFGALERVVEVRCFVVHFIEVAQPSWTNNGVVQVAVFNDIGGETIVVVVAAKDLLIPAAKLTRDFVVNDQWWSPDQPLNLFGVHCLDDSFRRCFNLAG